MTLVPKNHWKDT